jgi:hypothetical protein
MPAALIFTLARERRRFMVSGGTRKALEISPVVSPPSARRVSATWASAARAGWQLMNTSSSRSSGIAVSSASISTAAWRSSSRVLAASVRLRRRRSIARLRAVVTSQAPGFAGGPSRGQRSAAIVNAS